MIFRSSRSLRIFLSLNCTGKSIFVSEVQQRHIKGPSEIFVLQDAQGRTKRSLLEIREHFPKKVEIKDGGSLYRYYRMDLQPSITSRGGQSSICDTG